MIKKKVLYIFAPSLHMSKSGTGFSKLFVIYIALEMAPPFLFLKDRKICNRIQNKSITLISSFTEMKNCVYNYIKKLVAANNYEGYFKSFA